MKANQKIHLHIYDDEIKAFRVGPDRKVLDGDPITRKLSHINKNQEWNIDLGDGTSLFIERTDNKGVSSEDMDKNIDFKKDVIPDDWTEYASGTGLQSTTVTRSSAMDDIHDFARNVMHYLSSPFITYHGEVLLENMKYEKFLERYFDIYYKSLPPSIRKWY